MELSWGTFIGNNFRIFIYMEIVQVTFLYMLIWIENCSVMSSLRKSWLSKEKRGRSADVCQENCEVRYVYQVFWLKAQKIQRLIALSLILQGGSFLSVVNVQKGRKSNEDFQNICKIFVANVQNVIMWVNNEIL